MKRSTTLILTGLVAGALMVPALTATAEANQEGGKQHYRRVENHDKFSHHDRRDFGHGQRDFHHNRRDFGHNQRDFHHDRRDFGHNQRDIHRAGFEDHRRASEHGRRFDRMPGKHDGRLDNRGHHNKPEVRQDFKDIRNARNEVRDDRRELRKDYTELRKDRLELRRDQRNGASKAEIMKDRQEICDDLLEIRKDRLELRKDQATLGAARQELKNDLRNRPMLPVDSSKTGATSQTTTKTTSSTTTKMIAPTTPVTTTQATALRTKTGQVTP